MILNNAPQNEAILSNVGEIGEFRIRNSAKAFNILSSGLYANKIKAIIRELSCNAIDSHVAAGNTAPFDVHLPNSLDAYFSIRDYGTGLSHDQVTNIYTTYFESTKTNSNEFIGALGLGSKSPFSYTDNFTVTAIKDGRKGIYSAFINGEGVPSIALMMEEATDEPAGVEIKFSVNDRYDFYKFKEEAESVYRYFKQRPNITGAEVKIKDREYETRDLLPGVHVLKADRRIRSVALMGNIAYPIDVPNAETALGEYAPMLACGLEIEFGIGEVDFQASREGLSYIPQTIEAIKNKLASVAKVLADRIKADAEAVTNLWDRAVFLDKKRENPLWAVATVEYIKANPLPTVDLTNGGRWSILNMFDIEVGELASKYNISVRAFERNRGNTSCSSLSAYTRHNYVNGQSVMTTSWQFSVSPDSHFVVTDTAVGAFERSKYHYRESTMDVYSRAVYVLEKADKTKDMDLVAFFAAIHNPPEARCFLASNLKEKPRKDSSVGRNVSILGMERRRRGYNSDTVVWTNAGKVTDFDKNTTHYYIPLSGYVAVSDKFSDAKQLREWLKTCGIAKLSNVEIYGVRKTDLEEIKKQTNWVNIETFIEQTLTVPDHNVIMNLVVDDFGNSRFANDAVSNFKSAARMVTSADSEFKKVVGYFDKYSRVHFSEYSLKQLYKLYGSKLNFDLAAMVKKFVGEISAINERYPLLGHLTGGQSDFAVAEYVNMIDSKGE